MNRAQEFPLNWGEFRKGDTVPDEAIAAWSGIRPGSRNWWCALLAFRDMAERHCTSIGKPMTFRILNGKLVALTDSLASTYNIKQLDRKRRGMKRARNRLCLVDRSQLTAEGRAWHDRALEIYSKRIAAMESVALPRALPYRRSVPGLPQPSAASQASAG